MICAEALGISWQEELLTGLASTCYSDDFPLVHRSTKLWSGLKSQSDLAVDSGMVTSFTDP